MQAFRPLAELTVERQNSPTGWRARAPTSPLAAGNSFRSTTSSPRTGGAASSLNWNQDKADDKYLQLVERIHQLEQQLGTVSKLHYTVRRLTDQVNSLANFVVPESVQQAAQLPPDQDGVGGISRR
eukprot:gene1025-1359_t